MSAENQLIDSVNGDNPVTDTGVRFMELTTRLLVEYSARTEMIRRQITRIAQRCGTTVSLSISYRQATLYPGGRRPCFLQVPELRLNSAVNVATLRVIDDFCASRITAEEAIVRLESAVVQRPEYGQWLLALAFGVGASALAWILRGDWGSIIVSGVASALGLVARKELGKRHVVFFALPCVAALIGALLAGLAIRWGWTQSYGICLVVPALMLVPGPHLIIAVQEMLENNMQTGIARLLLGMTILIAASLGVVLGASVTLGAMELLANPSPSVQLTLPMDIGLAGLATCAFGAFYNTPRRILWVAILCGMVGHGIRYVCMDLAMSQVAATLLGCLAIGIAAMMGADRFRLPFATVAFAGAVSMMPGVFMYESLSAALAISAAGNGADPALVTRMVALVVKSVFVVGAMAIGLLAGAWVQSRFSSSR